MIFESESFQGAGRKQVAAVNHKRTGHGAVNSLPVELFELFPLGDYEQSLRALRCSVSISGAIKIRETPTGLFHCLGIEHAQSHPFPPKALDQFHRRSEADVVGIGFECEPEHADLLLLENPKGPSDFLNEPADAFLIHAFGFAEDGEVHSVLLRQSYEGLKILRQAEAAKSEARMQEMRTDTRIEADAMHYLLDIGAELFREIGDHVGIGDLEREKRIGGMLD